MDYSAPTTQQGIEEDLYYPNDNYSKDYRGSEIVEDDEDAEYVELNGQMNKIDPINEDDVVFEELEHNIKEYNSLQERIELQGDYPYFEDYIGGHSVEEVTESDALYNEWVSLQPKHIKYVEYYFFFQADNLFATKYRGYFPSRSQMITS